MIYFEKKFSKNSVVWFEDPNGEYEKKYLYHDVYQSLFNNFWLVLYKEDSPTFHVVHYLNEEMKVIKELIFVGPKDVDEAFSTFKMYFYEEFFGGMEVFPINLLDKLNFLSKDLKKPIISYEFNYDTLKENEMVDNHVNVLELVEYDICPLMDEIMNERNPLTLWGSEKTRRIYHLWNDPNTHNVSEKGTLEENQFFDNLYNPRFIGKYGQLDNVDIDYDNTTEYKRGTTNNVFFDRKETFDLIRIKKDIEQSYERLAKIIAKNINMSEKDDDFDIIKRALAYIAKNKEEIYKNHGIFLNSKNINKVIKHLIRKC